MQIIDWKISLNIPRILSTMLVMGRKMTNDHAFIKVIVASGPDQPRFISPYGRVSVVTRAWRSASRSTNYLPKGHTRQNMMRAGQTAIWREESRSLPPSSTKVEPPAFEPEGPPMAEAVAVTPGQPCAAS